MERRGVEGVEAAPCAAWEAGGAEKNSRREGNGSLGARGWQGADGVWCKAVARCSTSMQGGQESTE